MATNKYKISTSLYFYFMKVLIYIVLLIIISGIILFIYILSVNGVEHNKHITKSSEVREFQNMIRTTHLYGIDSDMVVQHGRLGRRDLNMMPYYWMIEISKPVVVDTAIVCNLTTSTRQEFNLAGLEHSLPDDWKASGSEIIAEWYVRQDRMQYDVWELKKKLNGQYLLVVRRLRDVYRKH